MSWLISKRRPARAWLISTVVAVLGLSLLVLDGSARPEVDLLGVLLALGSALGYAAYTVMGRVLIDRGHQSSEVMASSFSLGGVLLIPVLLTQPLVWLTLPSGIVMAVYLGLVTTTIGYVLFGRGLSVLDPGPVTTLVLAEPLVATILSVAILGERLGALGWSGFIIVLTALVGQGLSEVRRTPSPRPQEVAP
jgi:DME family drug/metabolite transporter